MPGFIQNALSTIPGIAGNVDLEQERLYIPPPTQQELDAFRADMQARQEASDRVQAPLQNDTFTYAKSAVESIFNTVTVGLGGVAGQTAGQAAGTAANAVMDEAKSRIENIGQTVQKSIINTAIFAGLTAYAGWLIYKRIK